MDATLLWTAVGSGAAAATVLATIGVAVGQGRSVRRHPPLTADEPVRVIVESPGRGPYGRGAGLVPAVVGMRPPTGRLPERVRGREDLAARLRALARAPDGRAHVLAGLGGTGKSTVALQVAEEVSAPGRAVWWVPAGDADALLAGLMGLAAELGAAAGEVTGALAGRRNPADLLWRWLEARPGWVLVFDNADDLDVLAVGGSPVGDGTGWIRPTTAGLVVVTSRVGDPQAWGRHAEIHAVGWLSPAAGAQVLADLAPGAGPPEDAMALAERLGGLPLALHHAGLALASDFAAERTFGGYLAALQDRFGQLMGHGAADDRAIVTSTWELSLDALAAGGWLQARPLLRVLSCLAPAAVILAELLDLEVLGRACPGGSPEEAADGLAALAQAGLITAQPGPAGSRSGLVVHPLVCETSRLRLDGEGPAQAGATAVALLEAAAGRLGHDRPKDWSAWVQLAVHQRAVWSYLGSRLARSDLARLAEVSTETAVAFVWAGAYGASEELARLALADATRLGPHGEEVQALRFRVASAYWFTGRHAEAEQEYREVLAVRQRVLGRNHARTLAARYAVALGLAERGQHEQAERELREVLADQQRVLGPDDVGTLATRHEIARILAERGQHEQAEREFREVLAAKEQVLGPDHFSALTTRHDIARMLAARGQHEQAEREFREVLADQQRVLGPDHPGTLATRHEIARILAERGQHEQAKREFREVLAAKEQVLGPDHPSTAISRTTLTGLQSRPKGQIPQ